MPYIKIEERQEFDTVLNQLWELIKRRGVSNGELNYLMSILAHFYIFKHGLTYNTGSDVIKAFECAKLEFYRRIMAPYEDGKIALNGDVYHDEYR